MEEKYPQNDIERLHFHNISRRYAADNREDIHRRTIDLWSRNRWEIYMYAE